MPRNMIMKVYLESEDIERMEKAADNLRDKLLIRVLFHLGCRISEALKLRVEDIDFSGGSVTIVHLKSRIGLYCDGCRAKLGRLHSFCPGCGRSIEKATRQEMEHRRLRTLPLDAVTIEMLREYIERDGDVSRKGTRLIFGINRHRAWQIVRHCADRAGLPPLVNPETGKTRGISPHRLRDAFAVRAMKMDDSGDGLRLLQEHLGHSSFDTTAKYRKVAGEEHRQWYDNLWEEDRTQ